MKRSSIRLFLLPLFLGMAFLVQCGSSAPGTPAPGTPGGEGDPNRTPVITGVLPLQFAAPTTIAMKSPQVAKPIQLRLGKASSLAVYSTDDAKVHLLSWNAMTQGFDDQTLSLDFGGSSFSSLLPGDINGDGALDLVVSATNGSLFVLTNDGKGNLSPPQKFATAQSNLIVWAVGKFNTDNQPDILFSMNTTSTKYFVGILLNQGNAGFMASKTTSVGQGISEAAWIDLDSDGFLDAVVRNGPQILVLAGTQLNEFQIPYILKPDDWTLEGMVVRETPSAQQPIFVLSGARIATGIEQLTGWSLQNGSWKVIKTLDLTSGVIGMASQDLNGDGILDTALAQQDQSIAIVLGDSASTFLVSPSLQGFDPLKSVAIADINGDQKPDMVVLEGTAPNLQLVWVPNNS